MYGIIEFALVQFFVNFVCLWKCRMDPSLESFDYNFFVM